jgi:ABC-type bacteriocin/lantibiotic exporter with double-glycine peptidase domain
MPTPAAGDASLAGERGINLSGGQRQRVCLARAAYHDAQVLLLDNPLSAVDQHTSKHIFDKCIKGLLAEKAVVLVAHQLELLPQVRWAAAGAVASRCASAWMVKQLSGYYAVLWPQRKPMQCCFLPALRTA